MPPVTAASIVRSWLLRSCRHLSVEQRLADGRNEMLRAAGNMLEKRALWRLLL